MIDCDVHLPIPEIADLLPYLTAHWREEIVIRGIDGFETTSYPPNVPANCRPDWRPRRDDGLSPLDRLRRDALEPFATQTAICICLHGGFSAFSEDLSAALVGAVNDWVGHIWLANDTRLRGSILLPPRSPELAVAEIERLAQDKRFVQVLLPVGSQTLLGRRAYWPIYEAAERHGLAVAIHSGSTFHNPPTASGWPSYLVEDYVSQSAAFQSQMSSFVMEGVFNRFPTLRVVLVESGFTWLPNFMWRIDKTWMGLRNEVPWVTHAPSEYLREQVRLTLQPIDAPDGGDELLRIIDQAGCENMLLFSTDYPHFHFDGEAAIPTTINDTLRQRMANENPRETYQRLQ